MLTALNRVSVSAGYNTVRRFRQLLMDYTIKCAEKNNVPIPSNLNREDFTMGGTDNSNYKDRSSISGTDGLNYSSSCLFQSKQNPPERKPLVSETQLKRRIGTTDSATLSSCASL